MFGVVMFVPEAGKAVRSRRTVAAHLGDRLDHVNAALRQLRDRGAVDVLAVGELEGHSSSAASYWRLTDQGREEFARLG